MLLYNKNLKLVIAHIYPPFYKGGKGDYAVLQ